MTTSDQAEAQFKADFAEMLEYHRIDRGWSKNRLAGEAGLPNGTVNPIVNQRKLATHASITALLAALDATQEEKDSWHARRQSLESPTRLTSTVEPSEQDDLIEAAASGASEEVDEEADHEDLAPEPQDALDSDEVSPGPSPDASSNPVQDPPPNQGWRRAMSRRWIVGGLVVLLVVAGLAGLWIRVWVTATKDIDGRVRCQSGAPVVGAWTKWGSGADDGHGVDVRPGSDGWYTFNGHTRTHHPYELHFGCGFIENTTRWKVIAYSPAGISASSLTLVCDDSPATVSQPPYKGVCAVRAT